MSFPSTSGEKKLHLNLCIIIHLGKISLPNLVTFLTSKNDSLRLQLALIFLVLCGHSDFCKLKDESFPRNLPHV
jgi:hypothetical protein